MSGEEGGHGGNEKGGDLNSEINKFVEATDDLHRRVHELREAIARKDEARRKLESAVSEHAKELKYFKETRRLRASLLSAEAGERLGAAMERSEAEMAEGKRMLPTVGGWFFRQFVGYMDVRLPEHSRGSEFTKTKFKNDYVDFKYTFSIFISLFSIVLVVIPASRTLDYLHHLVLVYFYVTLTLRESVLQPNGSDIKLWWTIHHYISTVMTIIIMTWPGSDLYFLFRRQFFAYGICQGIIGLLQVHYQRQRIYSMVSLGKANDMAVPEDNFVLRKTTSIEFLVPFVTFLHLYQAYNSYTLFTYHYSATEPEWQVSLLALLWGVVSIGNIFTTYQTLFQKKQRDKMQARAVASLSSSSSSSSSSASSGSNGSSDGTQVRSRKKGPASGAPVAAAAAAAPAAEGGKRVAFEQRNSGAAE